MLGKNSFTSLNLEFENKYFLIRISLSVNESISLIKLEERKVRRVSISKIGSTHIDQQFIVIN